MAPHSKHSSRKASSSSHGHRSTLSLQKTEVIINIYDLLPVGRLSSALWMFGSSLLHSAVVLGDKEYAFGGTEQKGVSGVYWTRPRTEPPGATFRAEILHGFTLQTEEDIQATLKEISTEFDGISYNLLTKNCNHFTSALCERLTSRPAPKWINRAAGIGLALPCIVPKQWIEPPDHDTADGELVDDESQRSDSHAGLLDESPRTMNNVDDDESSATDPSSHRASNILQNGRRSREVRDTASRMIPPSEVAV
ncbi:MAG: hypothetical protein M1814_004361 [Vezdaea aestivalis]|nr:MAG: hypothetical protein M1814_004361 [Vezdaea aestivalis]